MLGQNLRTEADSKISRSAHLWRTVEPRWAPVQCS